MDVKKIGKFIALNRKKKGLTQEQLGEKLGVSNKTISRWENGNYMPDLSLLKPLSHELGISLNELLSGEKLEGQNFTADTENNLIQTIDYTSRKIQNEHNKLSLFIMIAGILLIISSFCIFSPESSWSSFYSVAGLILFVFGLYRQIKTSSIYKKIAVAILIFTAMSACLITLDYVCVVKEKRPPIYKTAIEEYAGYPSVTAYRNPFYSVYRINVNTPNEYYIIDTSKKYTEKTIPLSPFNLEKSGIENIYKYKNSYVGASSNTCELVNSLPLSEYGFVLEIDSDSPGLTIDYHSTDWYISENIYVEKSLIYNSAAIFSLIDNVQYIKYNFSGSSYTTERENFEKNYPGYEKIINKGSFNKNNFSKYVESKMNDKDFLYSVFPLLFY